MYKLNPQEERLFEQFIIDEKIDADKAQKFKQYLLELFSWNERIDLTAITTVKNALLYHFQDSLQIKDYVDFQQISMIADIGTGAGFPGLPLKIFYPSLALILIEVSYKRIQFLESVIETLGLENIEIVRLDWRTFLRKTEYPIDIFCARASLAPSELLRMFKPGCIYKKAQLIYWASTDWQPADKELPFIKKEKHYKVGNRKRKFVFFSAQ
ncbi:MAG: 16S rRNA (guanine(527)-N(7))-methyltransferase RsmG [Candidatus Babeliales bacterium]